MKLETEIKPRRDGTVRATLDDTTYVFEGEERLTCEVKNKAHVARLLSLGGFFPYDVTAIPAALAVVEEAMESEGEGEDQADDEGDEAALPVESNTPPKRFKPKAKK
jgi:hypothetical protein